MSAESAVVAFKENVALQAGHVWNEESVTASQESIVKLQLELLVLGTADVVANGDAERVALLRAFHVAKNRIRSHFGNDDTELLSGLLMRRWLQMRMRANVDLVMLGEARQHVCNIVLRTTNVLELDIMPLELVLPSQVASGVLRLRE